MDPLYEEGKKNREEVHTAGSKEQRWTAWRSDGQKWAEGTLVGHQAQGPYSEWHPNGTLAVEGHYTQGAKTGGWRYWDVNGQASAAPQGDFSRD